MGEWSEYFADFPEEAADYLGEPDDHGYEASTAWIEETTRQMNAEAQALIAQTIQQEKDKFFECIEDCPQCGFRELKIYKLNREHYHCECQDCGIYGSGASKSSAIAKAEKALGEGLDWRENISWLNSIKKRT